MLYFREAEDFRKERGWRSECYGGRLYLRKEEGWRSECYGGRLYMKEEEAGGTGGMEEGCN